MNNSYQIYVAFNSRSQIESVIDILREEGFRSPDLQVMVGLPDNTTCGRPELTLHAHRWFAGVPTSHYDSEIRGLVRKTHPQTCILVEDIEPDLYKYLASGGLLLTVTIRNDDERAVALEVFEDLGANWFEGSADSETLLFQNQRIPTIAKDDLSRLI